MTSRSRTASFALCGEGVNIGCEGGGAPVTDDYSADTGHRRIAGATIKGVAVDISGEPYLDLEKKLAIMKRD
jgi:hypothetical protein